MSDTYAVVCECGWRATLSHPSPAGALALADELAGAHLRDRPECDEPWVEISTRMALPRRARSVPA